MDTALVVVVSTGVIAFLTWLVGKIAEYRNNNHL